MKLEKATKLGVSAFREFTLAKPGVSHRSGSETNVLKRSIDNAKFGKQKVWRAGKFKGMPLYSLTLEERATCDNGCQAWNLCYGNNMPFATRFKQGKQLEKRLAYELDKLDVKHPDGYSIRLHVLGDFYSVGYVGFWSVQLAKRPALHIFGYTHRQGSIRKAIDEVWKEYRYRFNILQSDDLTGPRPSAIIETVKGSEKLVTCMEQTGKAQSCLDCGFCTNDKVKGVRFLVH